jgi:c-di-GMP-binding flagellar brake protein YcgR
MQVLPNQLVELHVETNSGLEIYRTRVEDAFDDLLIVGAPIKQGVLVPIRIGTRLNVQFRVYRSVNEGRYNNEAIVEKRFRANVPLLQLRMLGSWEKIQERYFLRVPVSIDCLFEVLSEDEAERTPQSGVMLDLSGGGFLLRTSRPLQPNDGIRVSFNLKDTQITANAVVARLVEADAGFDYGICFVDIPERLRQVIIKFVFQRQIALAEMTRDDRD